MYNRAEGMILYGFSEIACVLLEIQLEHWMIDEAIECAKRKGLNFPEKIFRRVVDEFNGYSPIEIEIFREGKWCPKGSPFAQIRNTVEGFGELVTWWEAVLMKAYFPSACATEAFHMRKYLEAEQKKFGYDAQFMWKFHSFGYRGHRSEEDAYWAGTAWDLFLHGTDDFHTALYISKEATIGSIAALAHKVTQQFDKEFDCYKHAIMTTASKGEKIVAIVIDTYDAYKVINEYLVTLCAIARQQGVHLVFRPDSGNTWGQAVLIYEVCRRNGIKNASVIIGENMSLENAKKCDDFLKEHGVPTNFVFYGIGGGFYNHITRDTLGWAMKTAFSNGKPRMKFAMEPIKRSIPGIVDVIDQSGELYVIPRIDGKRASNSIYTTIYSYDGTTSKPLFLEFDWEETRQLALTQDGKQERIYIDARIADLVEEFKKIYKQG
jgi:nicotinamide phosphoribosyltransferase